MIHPTFAVAEAALFLLIFREVVLVVMMDAADVVGNTSLVSTALSYYLSATFEFFLSASGRFAIPATHSLATQHFSVLWSSGKEREI